MTTAHVLLVDGVVVKGFNTAEECMVMCNKLKRLEAMKNLVKVQGCPEVLAQSYLLTDIVSVMGITPSQITAEVVNVSNVNTVMMSSS